MMLRAAAAAMRKVKIVIADQVLIRRAEVVRIHLRILEELLKEAPSVSQAIRASISLRFLFDGSLNTLAYEYKVALGIPAPDLSQAPINEALLFACGGYMLGGKQVAPYYAYREPGLSSPYRSQFELQARTSPSRHTLINAKLGSFQQTTCLAIVGTTFTRDQIVRYVANRCGGAHHHDDTSKFREFEQRLTSVGHSLTLSEHGISVVLLEVLGTAWFLLNSKDIVALQSILSADMEQIPVLEAGASAA